MKCNLCSESFVRVEPFEKHKKVHEDKPHHSKFCKYSSIRKSSVDIHAKIHFDERPFECNHCPKRYRSKRCIVLHTRVHTLTLSWFIQMKRTYVVIFAKGHLKQWMLWKLTNLALMLKREFFLQRLPWKLQNKWDPSATKPPKARINEHLVNVLPCCNIFIKVLSSRAHAWSPPGCETGRMLRVWVKVQTDRKSQTTHEKSSHQK